MLEEKGVYADVKLTECAMDWIPFDDDVLSMELDGSLRECALVSNVCVVCLCMCACALYATCVCAMDWISFDDDVLSMELDGSLRECALVSDVFICTRIVHVHVHVRVCRCMYATCVCAQWTGSHLMMTCYPWSLMALCANVRW